MKSDKTIIGIDFSLNGPGFCILGPTECKWISLHRTKNIIDNMFKKDGSPFKILNDNSNIDLNIIEKKQFKGEYHVVERDKIINAVYFAEKTMELLDPYLNSDTIVGMEGLSFGSSGNSLIDISMTTALVRSSIIKKIDPNNFFVISPTTVKKFALKGNSKKDELYNELIDKRSGDNRMTPFVSVLREYKDSWIKGPNKVESPCSDLVDATWIALLVEENLEKLLSGKKI